MDILRRSTIPIKPGYFEFRHISLHASRVPGRSYPADVKFEDNTRPDAESSRCGLNLHALQTIAANLHYVIAKSRSCRLRNAFAYHTGSQNALVFGTQCDDLCGPPKTRFMLINGTLFVDIIMLTESSGANMRVNFEIKACMIRVLVLYGWVVGDESSKPPMPNQRQPYCNLHWRDATSPTPFTISAVEDTEMSEQARLALLSHCITLQEILTPAAMLPSAENTETSDTTPDFNLPPKAYVCLSSRDIFESRFNMPGIISTPPAALSTVGDTETCHTTPMSSLSRDTTPGFNLTQEMYVLLILFRDTMCLQSVQYAK